MSYLTYISLKKEFGIERRVEIFEVKLLVPVFIGLGSLLYPLAIGSKIISSNTKLNLNTDLLNPSKHSSVAFTPEL